MNQQQHAAAIVCDVLGVSRAGYYAWRREMPSTRELRDQELLPLVQAIFAKHRRRYGARRIARELHDRGERCGVERVAKLLKIAGLKAIQPKSFQPKTTDSRHTLGYSPNLLLDREPPVRVNEVWVGDITYVPLRTHRRFAYLALLMDLFSRRIVGWQLRDDMTEALTLACLTEAIRARQPPPGLIHHTDRGGQYAGHAYRTVLRRASISQSMSRADNCYDNAFQESCFGTIKTELEMTEYENIGVARKEIRSYISYYNHERFHSALGYLSPVHFERHTDSTG